MELMGSAVVQIACGRRHLVVATASGRLQACGLAGCGQLGSQPPPAPSLVSLPRIINMPWNQLQVFNFFSMIRNLLYI